MEVRIPIFDDALAGLAYQFFIESGQIHPWRSDRWGIGEYTSGVGAFCLQVSLFLCIVGITAGKQH